jgi:uncharacterized repeat protein (TIGR03803 family)
MRLVPMRRLAATLVFAVSAPWLAGPAAAQAVERTLHDFDEDVFACFYCTTPPIEGHHRELFGTLSSGGAYGWGILYRYTKEGGFEVLHDFGETLKAIKPVGSLVQLANGDLLGVNDGGKAGRDRPSSLWRYKLDGRFRVLDQFIGPNGKTPDSLMMTNDGRLYGTTYEGGEFKWGVLFTVDESWHIQVVHSFTGGDAGAKPKFAPVLASDGALYGIAQLGGKENLGGIWRYGADGQFELIHSFTAAEGSFPSSKLVQAHDGALYGMMSFGPGDSAHGSIYRLTLDGAFTTVHAFTGPDGSSPLGGLVEDAAGNLLGATESSTNVDTVGTAFKMTLDGTLTTLHHFSPAHDGRYPNGLMLTSTGRAYGAASYGGAFDKGTLWQLTLP